MTEYISKNSLISSDQPRVQSWQAQLSAAITEPKALLELLNIPQSYLDGAIAGAKDFPIRVPLAFASRIEKGNIHDPLLRQIIPLEEECQLPPDGFVLDPLEEAKTNTVPGIVHKYHGRVLLITNGNCAVNCRYCFRRHFPYDENRLSSNEWLDALDYIRQRPDINEVILSGGDPLTNNDQRLFKLISAIEAIPHVTRLRIHTRLPIVIPARITEELVERLSNTALAVVVVLHANHAKELDSEVKQACSRLHQAGIHILNQTVLLKGVNDSEQALINLSERLFTCHIMPYYLHLLDPVIGAHHFDVSQQLAQSLMAKIALKLPGFLLPKLVREIAGEGSKTAI